MVTPKYTYKGEWKNGEICGQGVRMWKASGAEYSGEFKDGLEEGMGVLRLPLEEYKHSRQNKDYDMASWIYTGSFKGGGKHGEGIEEWGIYRVWVTYDMGKIVGAWLQEQVAPDKMLKTWVPGVHARGRIQIEHNKWTKQVTEEPVDPSDSHVQE